MHIPRIVTLLMWIVALSLCVWGQDNSSSGEEDSLPGPAQMPLLKQKSLALAFELERSNYVSAGISAGMYFDDNALNTSTEHTSNLANLFAGHIELAQSRSQLRWNLSYGGGVVVNQNIHTGVEPAHDLRLTGQYRLTPHVSLVVNNDFSRTTTFNNSEAVTGVSEGLLHSPNQTVLLPLAKVTSNISSAELDYQFGPNSEVGMSGNFNLVRYSDEPIGTVPLIDSNSLGGDAFYMHRLAARNWGGLLYRYQTFTFPSHPDRTVVHSILLSDTMYIRRHLEISLFAGPEQVNNNVPIIGASTTVNSVAVAETTSSHTNLSFAAGGSFGWNGVRTSFMADASRMVSDGGGLTGAVQLTSVSGNIRHQFTGSFYCGFGVLYGDSANLSGANLSGSGISTFSPQALSVYGAMTRTLRNGLALTLGYSRSLQQNYGSNGPMDINHNRTWATVSYNFTRPIGR